jgi:hypothetical protein
MKKRRARRLLSLGVLSLAIGVFACRRAPHRVGATSSTPTWLDSLFQQTQFAQGGTALPVEPVANFVSGATLVDNPSQNRTDITITAVGGDGGSDLPSNPSVGAVPYYSADAGWAALSPPPDAGYYLQGGVPPSWAIPSGGGSSGGGWVTALDFNFATQSNQTLATDTTYTIGGVVWTKINSANDATAMAIVNGSGLEIKPVSATAYGAGTRTLPALTVNLSNLISGFYYGQPIRVWYRLASLNLAANSDSFVGCVELGTYLNYCFFKQYDTGPTIGPAGYYLDGLNGTYYSGGYLNNGAYNTNDVFVGTLLGGVGGSSYVANVGVYSSGWPSAQALNLDQVFTGFSAPANAISGGGYSTGALATQWDVLVGAARYTSGTSLTAIVSNLRIDYKP